MRVVIALVCATFLSASAFAVNIPATFRNAEVATAESTPAAAFERLHTGEWVGFSVPAVPGAGDVCCFNDNFASRSCSLSDEDNGWGTTNAKDEREAGAIYVLLEAKNEKLGQVRLLAPLCQVNGGKRKVVWLGSVDPDASLALLGKLLDDPHSGEESAERVLAAVAYHASPKADAILERRALAKSLDEEARKQAIFWAGNLRGKSGYRLIERVLATERDGDIRQHCIFALTQCDTPEATERIKQIALDDRDSEVRAQALFWLAQTKAPGAGEWILARLDAEKDEHVREQAVFALSQLPDGTDRLLEVLRSKRDPETVRRALFWLGQSDDPRALEEIEKILER